MNKGKIYAIITTNRCNLCCKYCYSGESISNQDINKETSRRVAKHILEDINANDIKEPQIIFEGNEPLLALDAIKNIVGILKENFIEKGIYFTIFSNLQNMNIETLKYIKKNNIYIHTSIDGPKKLHDSFRGKRSFEKTVFWIRELMKEGVPVNVSTTICSESLKYPREIVDTLVSLGLKSINLRYLHRLGMGKKNWGTLGYNPKQYLGFYKKVLDYIQELNKKGTEIIEQKALFVFCKIKNYQEKICLYSPPCSGIQSQSLYDPYGDIYTCDEGRNNPDLHKIGDVDNGINHKKSMIFSNKVREVSTNCKGCEIEEYCNPCLALNSPITKNCVERCVVTKELFNHVKNSIKDKRNLAIFERYSQ